MTERFRFITAGESHGKALTAIIEGMVSGLSLDAECINRELKRRQAGYGRSSRMKLEKDEAEITAGIWHGLTMGSPISLLIHNKGWRDWQDEPVFCPRPGHADLAGVVKYGIGDIRPIMERASARETAARVAAGAVAKRFLEELGIAVHSHTTAIGQHHGAPFISRYSDPSSPRHSEGEERPKNLAQSKPGRAVSVNWKKVEASPVRCADAGLGKQMMAAIDQAKADGDTLGGIFEVITDGVPVGLGSHIRWDCRLEGKIARAIMSINAVKGVEIGDGFALVGVRGSQAHDVIEPAARRSPSADGKQSLPWHRPTNHAGGIEGGISNGENIVVRAVVKPIATLAKPLDSIDLRTGKKAEAHYERSDVCVVPAAGVIAEAMLAVVLADACLEKFGGDSLKETLANWRSYLLSISKSWSKLESEIT